MCFLVLIWDPLYALKKMKQADSEMSDEENEDSNTDREPSSRRSLFPSGTVGVLPCGMLVSYKAVFASIY